MCRDIFINQNFDSNKIANEYSLYHNQNCQQGYNHFIFTPSQFYSATNSLPLFYQGLIPAIIILNQPFFYIETSNHSYPDYYCTVSSISSTQCPSSFARLNSTINWKILLSLSSNFVPSLSKIFNYNVSFSKVYTSLSLDNTQLTTQFLYPYPYTYPNTILSNYIQLSYDASKKFKVLF